MPTLQEAARQFLALKRVAVAGVSRQPNQTANFIYRKLRDRGIQVIPVNPAAKEVEGTECYPNLTAIPGGVEGVLIATRPEAALDIVRECDALGVRRVWMHKLMGRGSVSRDAVEFCRQHGISVIDGACPMMFAEPVDVGHKCFRWILRWTGGLPRTVNG